MIDSWRLKGLTRRDFTRWATAPPIVRSRTAMSLVRVEPVLPCRQFGDVIAVGQRPQEPVVAEVGGQNIDGAVGVYGAAGHENRAAVLATAGLQVGDPSG